MTLKANTQVNTFGAMIGCTEPKNTDLSDKNAVLGMTFDKKGVPIEVAQIMLAGKNTDKFTIFLADEFIRMNGTPEQDAKKATENTITVIKNLSDMYRYSPNIILASELMATDGYKDTLERTKSEIQNRSLQDKLRKSIPENRTGSPLDYAEHEIACIQHLIEEGINFKIGPERETHYDTVMKELEMPVSFGYLPTAYAIATKNSEPVNHYNGASRGKTGQRLHFDDIHNYNIKKGSIEQKLRQTTNEDAALALLMIAGASAEALGKTPRYDLKTALSISGNELYKAAKQEMMDHVVMPYREVIA